MKTKIRQTLDKHFYLLSIVFAIPIYIIIYVLCIAFGENPYEYFPTITMITLGSFGIGLFLFLIFQSATKEKCLFCHKKLGEDYLNGKCMWKDIDNNLWSHKKCIPKREILLWRSTE